MGTLKNKLDIPLVVIGDGKKEKEEAKQFMEANGLGDLELLCDQAPIEIGNRVWLDLNGNGVQDPDEPPITTGVDQPR